jgi:hypothetical protein
MLLLTQYAWGRDLCEGDRRRCVSTDAHLLEAPPMGPVRTLAATSPTASVSWDNGTRRHSCAAEILCSDYAGTGETDCQGLRQRDAKLYGWTALCAPYVHLRGLWCCGEQDGKDKSCGYPGLWRMRRPIDQPTTGDSNGAVLDNCFPDVSLPLIVRGVYCLHELLMWKSDEPFEGQWRWGNGILTEWQVRIFISQ